MFKNNNKHNVMRFAPSPSGYIHLGTARTMLFNYVMSLKIKADFILRIDDTNADKSSREYLADIYWCAKYFGINFKKIFHQSDRKLVYEKYLAKLFELGMVFYCKCQHNFVEGQEPLACVCEKESYNSGAVRFCANKVNSDLHNFIIRRSDGTFLYLFSSVADDIEEGVTYIIRGVDHIANLPKQQAIAKALEYEFPHVSHISLIHDERGNKLSKRLKSESFKTVASAGFMQQAMINFLLKLVWSDNRNLDYFKISDIIENFEESKFSQSSVVYNYSKLLKINQHYMQNAEHEVVYNEIVEFCREFRIDVVDSITKPEFKESFLNLFGHIVIRSKTYDDMISNYKFLFEDEPSLEETLKQLPTNVLACFKESLELKTDIISQKNFFCSKLHDMGIRIDEAYRIIRIFSIGKPDGIDPFLACNYISGSILNLRFKKLGV